MATKSYGTMAAPTTALTTGELEALASQCRDPSFRNALDGSPLWTAVAATLGSCSDGLRASFTRSAGPSDASVRQRTASGGDGEDEDDGLSYSFSVRKDASMDEIAADSVTVEVVDVGAALAMVEQATSAFRFLRNACASSPPNQDACREHGLLHHAHDLILQCCVWSDVEEAELAAAVVLLSQVALQFSVNAITGNTLNQSTVWSLCFPDDFQRVLVECHNHRKVVAFTAALMLNCVNKTLDDEGVSKRRVELVEARNLIITLLQRCLTRPTGDDPAQPSAATIDDHDPAFEWLCLLFKALFEAGYAKHLYNAVGAHLLSKLWSRVTPEQLILLRMFTMWMTSHRTDTATPGSAQPSDKISVANRGANAIPLNDEDAYETVFEFATKTYEYIVSEEIEDRPQEADELRKQMWIEFENEAKLLLLDVMGELTLTRISSSPSIRELTQLMLQTLLDELERAWQLRRLGAPAPPRPGSAGSSSTQSFKLKLPATEPFGYRSGIIRVVGNLTYRHNDNQDLVREGGYLPLFLNHCNIDEPNPFLREWSLVALRNLCEGNEANQAYINALRPQGIDRTSVDLDSMNVDAILDEEGKLKVTPKPSSDA